MRTVRTLALVALAAARPAVSQSGEAPCAAVTTTTFVPCDVPAGKDTGATLATVDGAVLGVADLDAELRKRIAGVDAAVAQARRLALDAEIADVRLHLEAERRQMSFRDFWEGEVLRKTPAASEADMKPIFEKQKNWYPGKTFADLRPRLEGIVLARNRARREAEVATSLKERFPATAGGDPGAPNLASDAVLATVSGRKITAASPRVLSAGFAVRRDLYYAEREALEKAVSGRLFKAEADRRGVTAEALRKAEIDDKVVAPTAEDVARAWEKVMGPGKAPTEEERKAVAADLKQERADELAAAFDKTLLTGRRVDVSLPEPEAPVLVLDLADAPARGSARAPVTVVEYADFECPHCAKAWGAAEEALTPYGDRVRYVYRHNPLPIHEHALKAAEAGAAAHAQGRFFDLAARMFRNQDALDTPSLKKRAAEAGCDAALFAADLDRGRYTASVLLEARDGERYGVAGTPFFFVNGVWLRWESMDVKGIRAAVDAALARAAPPPIPKAAAPE